MVIEKYQYVLTFQKTTKSTCYDYFLSDQMFIHWQVTDKLMA